MWLMTYSYHQINVSADIHDAIIAGLTAVVKEAVQNWGALCCQDTFLSGEVIFQWSIATKLGGTCPHFFAYA